MPNLLERNELGQFVKGSSNPWNKGKKCPQLGFQKGNIPWNKELKGWTKGTKAGFQMGNTLGKIRKGMKASLETIKKLRESHIGKNTGKNHPNWKGGITSLVEQIRHCFKYRQWRLDVFTRDNFTCQECGIRGGNLEADHYPKSFAEILEEYNIKTLEEALACEELWNINGGRTLCERCHQKTNTYGSKKQLCPIYSPTG